MNAPPNRVVRALVSGQFAGHRIAFDSQTEPAPLSVLQPAAAPITSPVQARPGTMRASLSLLLAFALLGAALGSRTLQSGRPSVFCSKSAYSLPSGKVPNTGVSRLAARASLCRLLRPLTGASRAAPLRRPRLCASRTASA